MTSGTRKDEWSNFVANHAKGNVFQTSLTGVK